MCRWDNGLRQETDRGKVVRIMMLVFQVLYMIGVAKPPMNDVPIVREYLGEGSSPATAANDTDIPKTCTIQIFMYLKETSKVRNEYKLTVSFTLLVARGLL